MKGPSVLITCRPLSVTMQVEGDRPARCFRERPPYMASGSFAVSQYFTMISAV